MKNPMRFFVGIGLLVLGICYGCGGEKYEVEMNAAQQAMEKAKSAFAEDLAPTNWLEAMTAWEQAQAAVKEGKPAKTYFLRAKSRFEKAALIAKGTGADMAKDITAMQLTISERFSKVQGALERGRLSPKVAKEVKPIAAEVQEGTVTLDSLVSQGNYLKAKTLARDLQAKVYNAELLVAGKKPAK
jgi:hypothetical protein